MKSTITWLSLATVTLLLAVVAFYTVGWFVPPALAAFGVIFAVIGGICAARTRREAHRAV